MKKIKTKNYVIYALICLITIILTIFITDAIKDNNKEKYKTSPLENKVEEVDIYEVGVVTKEMNNVILYIGFTNDKKTYASEDRILKYINNYDLKDDFLYVNIDKYLKGDKYIEILKDNYPNLSTLIKTAPMLIYIKDGEAKEVISNTDGFIYTSDLEHLNEKYNLGE